MFRAGIPMDKRDVEILITHLRRVVRNFALYEAVATGACTIPDLAQRIGITAASLRVKLARARNAAKEELAGIGLKEVLPDEETQRESLD